jgi:hypothetical protein
VRRPFLTGRGRRWPRWGWRCRRIRRLAKVQADIQAYHSVPEGQAGQVNIPALLKTRQRPVGLKTAISDANWAAQRDIYDPAEKQATAPFLAGVNIRHAAYPSTSGSLSLP